MIYIALALIIIGCMLLSCASNMREGNDPIIPLTSPQYYVMRTLINQIKIDDPSLSNAFDISAIIQLPFLSGKYDTVLNNATDISSRLIKLEALLDEEPAKSQLASGAFADVNPNPAANSCACANPVNSQTTLASSAANTPVSPEPVSVSASSAANTPVIPQPTSASSAANPPVQSYSV